MLSYKRQLLFIVFAVMLCACVLVFAACEAEPLSGDHTHSYALASELPATCTESGLRYYKCSCGDSYTETVNALGHDLSWAAEEGGDWHWQQCARCSYKTELQNHDFSITVSDDKPTCTQEGVTVVKCLCGAVKTLRSQASEHSFTETEFDNTGHWTKCSVCGTREENSFSAHSFDIENILTPSTCLKQGTVEKKCSCDATLTEQLPLAGHDYTEYSYTGTEHWLVCAVCKKEKSDSRQAHNMQVSSHHDATCLESGETITKCVCGANEVQVSQALGHDLDKSKFPKSTDEGHAFQCTRCESWVYVEHSYEPCDCPDGKAKAPTCGVAGHSDEKCSVCNYVHDVTIPPTGAHVWSSDYQSNDAEHWHICTVCNANGATEQHEWQNTDKKEPSCAEKGWSADVCRICKKESVTELEKTEHTYEYDETTRRAPTCTQDGYVEKLCSVCGNRQSETSKALGHRWGAAWISNENNHWHECTVCGEQQTSKGNHNYRETFRQPADCTTDGFYAEQCTACGYEKTTSIPKHHTWVTTDEGRVDPTCVQYGSHVERCDVCGETQTITDIALGFAPHQPFMVEEKAPTEEERGWHSHWTCFVCHQNFTTKNCGTLYPDDELYLPATRAEVVDTIEQLISIAQTLYKYSESETKYRITASAFTSGNTVMLQDQTGTIMFDIDDPKYDLSTIGDGDTVTVAGYIVADGYDNVIFRNAEILSVDDGYAETATLTVNIGGDSSRAMFYAYSDEVTFTLAYYSDNCYTVYFNSLCVGETLTFNFTDYGGVGVRSIIINGESYTMTKGELSVEITGDMMCAFDLNKYNELDVTVDNFDLPWAAPSQRADAYVSYQFVNNKVDNGNIVKGSELRFTVKNAYITRIEIEFENQDLAEVAKNTLKIGTDANHANNCSYALKGTTAKIEFDVSNKYAYFEYCADNHLAAIKWIKIYYETYNS